MLSFFKKEKEQNDYSQTLSWLNTDMHCHVLPGIDDGTQNIINTIEMLKFYEQQGIKKIIATPHIKTEQFPNNKQTIHKAWLELSEAVKNEKIDIEVFYSAEYYLDAYFLKLFEAGEIIPMPNNYLLVEVSLSRMPMDDLMNISFSLIEKGYVPVLAHPERYLYWRKSMDNYDKLKNKGWLLQLNLLSLIGYYGDSEKKAARYIVDNDLVDFAGTDAHNIRHLRLICSNIEKDPWLQKLKNKYLLNKFIAE